MTSLKDEGVPFSNVRVMQSGIPRCRALPHRISTTAASPICGSISIAAAGGR
jgi:hypothetical protein